MPSTDYHDALRRFVRQQQLVVGTLVIGASIMLAVVAIIARPQPAPQAAPLIPGVPLTYLILGLAAFLVLPRMLVPQIAVRQAQQQILSGNWRADRLQVFGVDDMATLAREHGDRVRLWPARWNGTILSAGLIEAPAILCLVAYFLERQPVALIAAVCFIVLLALHVPRLATTERWLDQQVARLDNQRALSPGGTSPR